MKVELSKDQIVALKQMLNNITIKGSDAPAVIELQVALDKAE
jgi:hypothetical protein